MNINRVITQTDETTAPENWYHHLPGGRDGGRQEWLRKDEWDGEELRSINLHLIHVLLGT